MIRTSRFAFQPTMQLCAGELAMTSQRLALPGCEHTPWSVYATVTAAV